MRLEPAPRFPFHCLPTGWYVVGRSDELPRRGVLGVRYFGEELALFRAEDGTAHCVDAYCPHLGAYLPEGGTVEGDRIRCPFHGFELDGRGRCVKTAYGTKAPPRARVRAWAIREHAGLVLVWYDALGRAPLWEVDPPDTRGWTPIRLATLQLATHPQETSENSVDFGHFSELHGFRRASVIEPCRTEGPLLTAAYSVEMAWDHPLFDRALSLVGRSGRGMTIRFAVRVHGLGYSLVEGEVPSLAMRFRQFVLSTPIDRERVHLRIGSSVERRFPGLDRLLREIAFRGLATEVARDRPIWETKRYVERPALAKGDGPIATYRRWCRQFYPVDAVARLPIAEAPATPCARSRAS